MRAAPAVERGEVPAVAPPAVSPLLHGWFRWYVRRYVARSFHALRVSRSGWTGAPAVPDDAPLLVVLTHPSWWDPLFALLLAERYLPGRTPHAPIEASALARYPFLGRLGLFPLAPGRPRDFLARAQAVLDDPARALWITPQGRFADPRERPLRLESGVGYLARSLERGVVLPLALELPFWEERTPEALARFGPPVGIADHGPMGIGAWTELVEARLTDAADALAVEARRRDPSDFEVVVGGDAGVGGVYDWWRRLAARLRGEAFDPSHGGGRGA